MGPNPSSERFLNTPQKVFPHTQTRNNMMDLEKKRLWEDNEGGDSKDNTKGPKATDLWP